MTDNDNSDNMDIFSNRLIQFYSNNATNLYHLTSHSICRVTPQNRYHNVTVYYCDVTSCYA